MVKKLKLKEEMLEFFAEKMYIAFEEFRLNWKHQIINEIGHIKYEDKWLKIILKEIKPKTKVYSVWSKCSNCEIGEIKWYPQWRSYCFVIGDIVLSDRCQFATSGFTFQENKTHKSSKTKRGIKE